MTQIKSVQKLIKKMGLPLFLQLCKAFPITLFQIITQPHKIEKASDNKLILSNKNNETVIKFCWGTSSERLFFETHYNFINNSHLNIFPSSIAYKNTAKFIQIKESLQKGHPLTINDVSPETLHCILKTLSPFYKDHIVKQNFNIKNDLTKYNHHLSTIDSSVSEKILGLQALISKIIVSKSQTVISRIHGDLTFRNIIQHNGDFLFVDFEQSEVTFPEYDYLNFLSDQQVYQSNHPSYEKYFEILITFLFKKENILTEFYRALPLFKQNEAMSSNILLLFINRFLIFRAIINLRNNLALIFNIIEHLTLKINEYHETVIKKI